MYRSFAAKKIKAHASRDPRDVEAVFEGAAAGPDLQAHNRSVLQDCVQAAIVSDSYVTTQSENNPRVGPHGPYLKGDGRLDKRDQH